MPFSRPTLKDLVTRVRGDIETALVGVDARLRASVELGLSNALAGVAHGLHGHLVWLSKQIMPDTAEEPFLDRWAGIYGIPRKPATKAAGPAGITGTNLAVCPAGAEWLRNDGAVFIQDASATIAGGVADVSVTAKEACAAGNTAAGSKLTLSSPVIGIDSQATVGVDGLVDGLDKELDGPLAQRLMFRLQTPPRGGGPGDYVQWALEVPGVTRAWEFPRDLGPGVVPLLFVVDNDPVSVIPDAAKVAEVQAHIDETRPLTAWAQVYAPIGVPVDFDIAATPYTPEVRATIEAQVRGFIAAKSVPRGSLYLSQINEAISLAAGEEDHVLNTPAANLVRTGFEMSVVGSFTWS